MLEPAGFYRSGFAGPDMLDVALSGNKGVLYTFHR